MLRTLLGIREPWIPVMKNDRECEIAYHRSVDFNEAVAGEYLKRLDEV